SSQGAIASAITSLAPWKCPSQADILKNIDILAINHRSPASPAAALSPRPSKPIKNIPARKEIVATAMMLLSTASLEVRAGMAHPRLGKRPQNLRATLNCDVGRHQEH